MVPGPGTPTTPTLPISCGSSTRSPATRNDLPVVGELQGDPEVLALEQRDDVLQVVLLLAGHAKLVALDLRLDTLGSLVADLLGDLLGLVRGDALHDRAGHLVGLAG